jgi:hypothetical protein
VSRQSVHQRVEQERQDTTQSYGFLALMATVGGVLLVVGSVIQTIARI